MNERVAQRVRVFVMALLMMGAVSMLAGCGAKMRGENVWNGGLVGEGVRRLYIRTAKKPTDGIIHQQTL